MRSLFDDGVKINSWWRHKATHCWWIIWGIAGEEIRLRSVHMEKASMPRDVFLKAFEAEEDISAGPTRAS